MLYESEDYEIWEPKLPKDYKEIIHSISKHLEINNSLETKKDIYNMLTKGVLLQDIKVLFSLGSKGERNELVSARMFSRKNHTAHKWLSVPESRFPKVLRMHDSSNLKIQIKIRTQFLPPSANYKVFIIFRFCTPIKSRAKRIYVNLKYKMGNETMHSYFATWREDGWMTIELFRFLNHKKDTDFEVLLESFSRCYSGRHSVKHGGIRKLKEVQQVIKSKSKMDKLSSSKMKVKKDHMTWFSLSEIKREKNEMLSAEKVVYNSSDVAIQSSIMARV
ncbi:hypothetical protein M8C21_016680 [Ambrosia artemisiifolia]|uniref:Uncharacterized protein n=1 Tax=Ambrosia artemisiifolia TaxID=4212 RepID=A0AAD5GU25_AMBAR|nr:hypothetical protein M8C21_016680 [Ambrosia artemisiifolia]